MTHNFYIQWTDEGSSILITKEALLKTGYFIDNEYLDMYIDLIYENKDTSYIRNATNNHHIIPKSYYRRINKPVDNSSENIVTVLFKDHVLAHYYLYLCTLNEEDRYSNACALNHLTGLSKRRGIKFDINELSLTELQRIYEESKRHFTEMMRGRFVGDRNPAKRPEVRKKISEAKKGHPTNPETNKRAIEAMRKANIGSDKSRITPEGYKSLVEKMKQKAPMKNPEYVEKMRKAVTGLRRVTNGVENKTIKPELLQEYIDKGFWIEVTFKTKPGKKT